MKNLTQKEDLKNTLKIHIHKNKPLNELQYSKNFIYKRSCECDKIGGYSKPLNKHLEEYQNYIKKNHEIVETSKIYLNHSLTFCSEKGINPNKIEENNKIL